MPRAQADWFRELDKIFAPQTFFMAVLDPADFGAGCVVLPPVVEIVGLPGEPVSSEVRWRPRRRSTPVLAHALPSRVSRSTNVPIVSIKMSTLSFYGGARSRKTVTEDHEAS
jgi:hypothetical protein